MIKVLQCTFQHCLGTFTILLVDASSKTGLFRHLSDYVFRVPNFKNTKSFFFSKCLKLKLHFKNAAKNSEKVFCFWDNCIWIGIVKLSLLRTGYFSSAANVLRTSPKISHVKKKTFSKSISLAVIDEYDKGAVMQISTVLGHVYHVACRRVLWNKPF